MRYLMLLLVLVLTACGSEQGNDQARSPVAIQQGDECHLCGMLISGFPGPKGQAWSEGRQRKFCSTRDLLTWALDPEHSATVRQIWVHDMSQNDWSHPLDTTFIDGRQAWYVLGSRARGAMGPTLASFASKELALAFAAEQGGTVLAFTELTLDRLNAQAGDAHPGH
ncbi:nitrous oxide reductase accessory protein NosL [Gallaecimonas sp. GXIMD4217]|uniref:nitrous oxide reductase accessory protein NosL n=1 Tax=Gallaecimonas sp. GXIMD4217 TaxID=3131927 RepID=UPI00311ABBA5